MGLISFQGACTLWPDGIWKWDWSACCSAHDLAYATLVPKAVADAALAACVNGVLPGMGDVMWWGVTLFGGLFYARAVVRYFSRPRPTAK